MVETYSIVSYDSLCIIHHGEASGMPESFHRLGHIHHSSAHLAVDLGISFSRHAHLS